MRQRSQTLCARSIDREISELLAPSVGIFTPTVHEGALVSVGQSIGTLDVLGVFSDLVVPGGVAGRVCNRIGGGQARVPVQYGDALLTISTASTESLAGATAQVNVDATDTLSFAAPMSGRFYSRPSPAEPPFVAAGDIVQHGQTIGLLEVMKTFNRLVYQGEALPARAEVRQVVPKEGDDVVRGEAILVLRSLAEK